MKSKKPNDLQVLLGYAGRHKGLTFLGLGLSAVAMILGMLPYICIWLVARDLIAMAPHWTEAVGIARYGWMAFAFALAGILVYFCALMCTHLSAFRTASNIRKQGMAHLMKAPLGFFDSNASGLLRNRLDGAAAETETLLAHNLAEIVGTAAMFIAMLVLMFVFDWRMGTACLLAAVVSIGALGTMMGGKNAGLMAEYQAAQDTMSKAGTEYVRGIPVVKVFQQTVYSFKAFKQAIEDYSAKAEHYLYGSCVSTVLIAIALFCYDWRLAIAVLWGVPVAFALLFSSRKLSRRNSEKLNQDSLLVSDGIQETLENIREIRATNQEERFLQALNDKIDRHEKTNIHGELVTGLFVNGASVIMRLGVATTILTGTGLILSGQIDFMLLFMFLLVITRVYAPFDQALALIAEMFMSQVSANRLNEIYDTPTAEGAERFVPNGHDIEFRNVGFSYDDTQVLKGVTFTAKEGEVTALVGPSGGGKSTCARLAARLWDIDQGQITVGGVDIAAVDPEVLLTDYSMVFQDVVLFDDTVMENIRLGRRGATDEEVRAAARAANCDEFVEKLPNGYQTPIGENGAKLSGGERQRISIARALLKNAPIVLLDEATASLDVENETRVQGALSRLLQGKTVLVIAHRMRTVEAADKIVVLADGKVAEEGSPAELMAKDKSIFRRMTQLQAASAGWSI